MDSEDTSSDEFTSFSYDWQPNECSNKNENNDLSSKKGCFVETSPTRMGTLEKLKQLSRKNDLRKNNEYGPDRKSSPVKFKNEENTKNAMKVCAQKLKLTYRPMTNPITSPTNRKSPVKREIPIVGVNRPKQLQTVKTGLEDKSHLHKSSAEPHVNKLKRGTKEIIEIIVYMPIIDSENNETIYPLSDKPIKKRHYVNEKEDILTFIANRRVNSNAQNLNRKINNNEYDMTNTKVKCFQTKFESLNKKTLAKTELSANDKRCEKVKDLGKCNDKCNDVAKNKFGTVANKKSKNVLEQEKHHCARKNSLNSSKVNDIKIVSPENKGNKRTCEMSKEIDETKKNNHENKKSPTKQSRASPNDKLENVKHNEIRKSKDVEGGNCLNDSTIRRWEEKKSKSVCSNKDYEENSDKRVKLECHEETFANRSVSLDLSSIGANKENGWRRLLPLRKALSTETVASRNNGWRYRKDEELTMECWIERSKYLQLRNQYLQCYRGGKNNWRTQ